MICPRGAIRSLRLPLPNGPYFMKGRRLAEKKEKGQRQGYLLGPGISMVAQLPDGQLRSLTRGMDCPPFPGLPTLIFDNTRLISGDWQEGQTGTIRS
jgi:hypothetical protein